MIAITKRPRYHNEDNLESSKGINQVMMNMIQKIAMAYTNGEQSIFTWFNVINFIIQGNAK